jgi:hypothetical protein
MHGIQHLFRQHALEKQTSGDSWQSACDSSSDLKASPWSQGKISSLSLSIDATLKYGF